MVATVSAVQEQLKNVRQIQATRYAFAPLAYAFAAILGDGSVVDLGCWSRRW